MCVTCATSHPQGRATALAATLATAGSIECSAAWTGCGKSAVAIEVKNIVAAQNLCSKPLDRRRTEEFDLHGGFNGRKAIDQRPLVGNGWQLLLVERP